MNADDVSTGPGRRRIILRRRAGGGSGGFSSGSLTQSESLRTAAETDEVDDIIDAPVDPDTASRRIRRGQIPPPQLPTPQATGPDAQERDNPRSRLNQVAMAGSQAFAKEYRLQLLHRMLMRNVPLDQIAQQLQVSISTVEKDRAELKKRLREAATQLNIDELVGGQNAVYDEISGMAMRIASASGESGGTPTAMRLAAMRTALAANADRTRFMSTAGVFDVLRFRRAEDGSNVSDVQHLMQRTLEMMQSLDDPPSSSPSSSDAFGPMSFSDLDASSSAQEIQEL